MCVCFFPPHTCTDGGKTLTFFNYDYKGEFQTVTFEGPDIKKIFYGSFHKVRFAEMLREGNVAMEISNSYGLGELIFTLNGVNTLTII